MSYRQYSYSSNGATGFVLFIIVLILLFAGLYFLFKGIFWLFTVLAPILFILTIILNFRVVLNFIEFVIARFKTNILVGILFVILTIIFYPLVTGYLFFKAFGSWYLKYKMKKIAKERYVEYEDLEDPYPDDFLELPNHTDEKPKPKASNDYDQLFK